LALRAPTPQLNALSDARFHKTKRKKEATPMACPKKQANNMNDPCGASFPDLPRVL
jgi:hypothetical protein